MQLKNYYGTYFKPFALSRYDVTMSQCWKLLPEERPTFSQLAYQLQEYWEEEHAYVIESIETP